MHVSLWHLFPEQDIILLLFCSLADLKYNKLRTFELQNAFHFLFVYPHVGCPLCLAGWHCTCKASVQLTRLSH